MPQLQPPQPKNQQPLSSNVPTSATNVPTPTRHVPAARIPAISANDEPRPHSTHHSAATLRHLGTDYGGRE